MFLICVVKKELPILYAIVPTGNEVYSQFVIKNPSVDLLNFTDIAETNLVWFMLRG